MAIINLREDLRVGFNVHAQGTGVKNPAGLETWCKDAKPSMMLVMDNPGYALKLKALGVPIVVHRMWTKESWYDQPVSNWFDAHQHLGDVYQALENERGFPLDYTLRFIQHNNSLAKPHRVCLWNISSGTPEPHQWDDPKLLDILRLMAKTPGRYAIGVHEYFHNNPLGFAAPTDWPTNWAIDAANFNSHIMRIGQLALVCQKHGVPMPDVFVTEAGTDNHGDLEPTLGKTGRGWKGAQTLWKRLYPMLSPAEAFYMGLWYTARVMYAKLPFVKGMAVFCYGHIVDEWNDFDCEDLPDLLALLRDWKTPALLTQFGTTNAPVTPPVPQLKQWKVAFLGNNYTSVILRPTPSTSGAKMGAISLGTVVLSPDTQMDGEKVTRADGVSSNQWIPVKTDNASGFISAAYAKLVSVDTVLTHKLSPTEASALQGLVNAFGGGSVKAKEIAPKLLELLKGAA